MRKLFITGSTGVLGRDLVRQILSDTTDEVVLLARSSHKHTAEERVRKLLDGKIKPEHFKRIRIVEGDVTLPNLGLSEQLIQSLSLEVDDFYHIAALTALNGSEEDCMKINFYGTEQALHIARIWRFKGKLQTFVYFRQLMLPAVSKNVIRAKIACQRIRVTPIFMNQASFVLKPKFANLHPKDCP